MLKHVVYSELNNVHKRNYSIVVNDNGMFNKIIQI